MKGNYFLNQYFVSSMTGLYLNGWFVLLWRVCMLMAIEPVNRWLVIFIIIKTIKSGLLQYLNDLMIQTINIFILMQMKHARQI